MEAAGHPGENRRDLHRLPSELAPGSGSRQSGVVYQIGLTRSDLDFQGWSDAGLVGGRMIPGHGGSPSSHDCHAEFVMVFMRGAMSTQLRSMRRTLHLLTGQPGAESVVANRDGSSLAEREVAVLSLAEFRAQQSGRPCGVRRADIHHLWVVVASRLRRWSNSPFLGGFSSLSEVAAVWSLRLSGHVRVWDRHGCAACRPAVGRLDWIMPAWWSSRLRSALATTGSPKMSPHSAKPRFEVRINLHFPCQASTSWRNGLPPPTMDRWPVSIAHVEFHTSRRVRRDDGSGPRIGDSSGRSGIPGRQR